ncbi:5-methylcytosine rRNA methyltransferase NSUN4 isoform X1 [Brachionus plicatilis]|uniref:NOL1/NOP2/Sun domain family member 4 n=1 Tax=Brachionus plicatilis TaxID=10195 RepID=A0A3M7RRP2_BRAPC|nr:5-methylcytosine rRNA methyltransferase NSUN4 isoform X1 [Brachionus plicatilis]
MYKFKNSIGLIFQRGLHKEVIKKIKEKKSSKNLALEYFDFFYGSTYGKEWHSMRLAMLTGKKYMALVNNFSNFIETGAYFEKNATIDVLKFLQKYHDKQNSHLNQNFPKNLNIFSFDSGDCRDFSKPKLNFDGLFNYYCMDGASLLPVFALDIKKEDTILDLCSSPGGKTLAILQTLLPKNVICRDISQGRLDRLTRMLKSYIPENELIKKINAPSLGSNEENFDRVLVDVPCTNDRHSLHIDVNNIFSKARSEERATIQKKQTELLTQAILSCKLNGTIVYSTCSLSPIQNEGVVNTVLNFFEAESKFYLKIEPLDYLKNYFDYFFTFSNAYLYV